MDQADLLIERGVDGGAGLGDLLREMGLSREYVAHKLDVSKHAIDSWCSGRSHVRLGKAGSLIRFLEERGADPVRLREMLLNQVVESGLNEQVARDYLGFRGHTQRKEDQICVILAHDLRIESQYLLTTRVRDELLRSGRKAMVLDCCGALSVRRFILQDIVPNLPLNGLIMCMYMSGIGLDIPAAHLARLGIPTVYIGERPRVLPQNAAFVGWDEQELGYIAGESVAKSGSEKIAIAMYEELHTHMARKNGFTQALVELCPTIPRPPVFLAPVTSGPMYRDHKLIGEVQNFLSQYRPQLIFVPSVTLGFTLTMAVNSPGGERLDPMTCVTFMGSGGWGATLMQRMSQPRFILIDVPIKEAAKKALESLLMLGECQVAPLAERTTIVPSVGPKTGAIERRDSRRDSIVPDRTLLASERRGG